MVSFPADLTVKKYYSTTGAADLKKKLVFSCSHEDMQPVLTPTHKTTFGWMEKGLTLHRTSDKSF